MIQPEYIGDSRFVRRLVAVGYACTALGAVMSLAAAVTAYDRFIFNYLTAVAFWGGIAVTAVFFSALQFLTRSGWSAAVRRIPELMGAFVPVLVPLLVPIALSLPALYGAWVHPVPGDVVVEGKRAWLNEPFFLVRMALYALVWIGLTRVIVGGSLRQDGRDDHAPTRRMWMLSAPVVILYSVTITFFAFDLLMSLSPRWYSTIFGVYYFSGSLVGALAAITILVVLLRRSGLLLHWLTPARLYDLGLLLFAFDIFWAYIAFSQYLLIWYANIPEEVVFFTVRASHGWGAMSLALVVLHFIVPFWVLLSQRSKQSHNTLLFAAVLLLAAHYLDVYWLVMPNYQRGVVPLGWIELAPPLAIGGIFLIVLGMQFRRRSAVPVNDPFLSEALG